MAAVRTLSQILLILLVISDASRSRSASWDRRGHGGDREYYSIIASIIDRIISYIDDAGDECSNICPCFTAEDIMENCMELESCSFTNSLQIQQEIVCENSTFKITPFNNQCMGIDQKEAIYTTDAQLTQCVSLISMSQGVLGCDVNDQASCPLDRSFTTRQTEDPDVEFDFDAGAARDPSVTSTITIDIDENDVDGLVLDDIVISVAVGHTRIGDVLATLSHNGMDVNLFGNDVGNSGHCQQDNIFVTITDSAILSAADLTTCEDNNGSNVNGDASLGFIGKNGRGVIGFGGTRQPLQALNPFIDQDVTMINGDWNLTLNDDTNGNIGYFGAWEITFVYVNDEVKNLCESALNDRGTGCCDLDENTALCSSTLEYCKSSSCLISRDNADNLETIINQLFRAVDLRCFSD